MRANEFINESKVADIKRLARAAAKKFKAGDEAAGNNPHPVETYLGKVWKETFNKMLTRIPDEPIAESGDERKAEYNMLRQLAKAADAKSIAASDELNKFPKGEMGLTPDSVKSDPAWQKAKKEFDSSFAELRHYNSLITKNYKKEHKAARDEERAARYDKPVTEDDGYGERKFKITYGGGNNYRNTRVIHADSKEEAEAWVNKWLGRPIETQEITTEREMFPDVRTYTPQQIAEKHGVSVQQIMNQLQKGIEIEYEHTKNKSASAEIALDHLLELPDYYDRLQKMEEGEVVDFPTDKAMANRGLVQDPVTGLWNPAADNEPIDYVVVSDSERGQIGHATKPTRKEADIEVKKLKLKGINAYVVEM